VPVVFCANAGAVVENTNGINPQRLKAIAHHDIRIAQLPGGVNRARPLL